MFGSGGGAADAYAIGGASPELVAAFTTQSDGTTAGEYYRKASSETTFDGLFTHSVSGLLTMFDSSGTLCWNPHNRIPYSEDFSQTAWTKTNVTLATDDLAAFGRSADKVIGTTGTAYAIMRVRPPLSTREVTTRVIARAAEWGFMRLFHDGPNTAQWFDLHTGTLSSTQGNTSLFSASITSLGDGWYQCDFVTNIWTNGRDLFIHLSDNSISAPVCDGTSGLHILSVTQFDSSLPMADNPDPVDAALAYYVETGATAKYLPRRQAYRYNSGWELAGMQMEAAAATNLHPTSNDFTTNWTNASTTETAGATTGPDDLTSGTKLVETTANNYHGILNYVAAVGRVTCSIHVKDAGDSRYLIGRMTSSGEFYVVFDPVTGTFTENANSSANITNTSYGAIQCKNGWWRVYMSADIAVATNSPYWGLSNTSTPGASLYTYTGTYGAGLFIYGAQTEAGELSSYIPTTGSTVTRAAETLSVAGADTPFNTTGFTIYEKGFITYADNDSAVEASFARIYKDPNDSYEWRFSTLGSNTGQFVIRVEEGNVFDTAISPSQLSPGVNVPFSAAVRYTSSDVQMALGGTAGTADTTIPAIADMSAITFTPLYNFNGYISELRYWGTDLAESGIAEVTT